MSFFSGVSVGVDAMLPYCKASVLCEMLAFQSIADLVIGLAALPRTCRVQGWPWFGDVQRASVERVIQCF